MLVSAIKYINWRFQTITKLTLVLRVWLSFSAQRYILLWVLLELNFLSFIAILTKSTVFKVSNKTLNYFLVQSVGRGLILIVIFMLLLCSSNSTLFTIYFLALLLKLGGAPFHAWYLSLVQKLSWFLIWVLSIWQKLIPLLIIRKPRFILLIVSRVARVGVRSLARLSQKSIKKILGLSSIFSLGWVLVSLDLRDSIWFQFMVGYGARLLVLVARVKISSHRISQDFNKRLKRTSLIMFILGVLMLRGIPPFIGFFLKLLILFYLIQKRIFLSLMFLVFSLLFIFVYLNIAFLLFTFVAKTFSWRGLLVRGEAWRLDLVVWNLGLRLLFFIAQCNLLHK